MITIGVDEKWDECENDEESVDDVNGGFLDPEMVTETMLGVSEHAKKHDRYGVYA